VARLWVALGVVVALAGTAVAKRSPPDCACAQHVVLPRPGAVDVPTNARLWTFGAGPAVITAPDQPIQSYTLEPFTHYNLSNGQTSFTTGSGPDTAAPVEPGIGGVTIEVTPDGRVETFELSGKFDADTAVVQIELAGNVNRLTIYTPVDRLSLCDPQFDLTPGEYTVTVTALDLAGNESIPATLRATTTPTRSYVHCVSPRDRRRSTGFVGVLVLAPFGLALGTALLLLTAARARRAARARASREPFALPATEHLARALRLHALFVLTCIAGSAAAATLDDDLMYLVMFASPILVVLIFQAISRFVDATRALGLLRYDGVTAEVKYDQVEVAVGKRSVLVRASRSFVERARLRGVPRARI